MYGESLPLLLLLQLIITNDYYYYHSSLITPNYTSKDAQVRASVMFELSFWELDLDS